MRGLCVYFFRAHRVNLVFKCVIADKTNLAKFYLGGRDSKAHPVYVSLANLPSDIRQSQSGALVAGLVPVYRRHVMPTEVSSDDHVLNSKRLLWAAYDRMLAPLIPERDEDPDVHFVNGFRYVSRSALVEPFAFKCGINCLTFHGRVMPDMGQICWTPRHHVCHGTYDCSCEAVHMLLCVSGRFELWRLAFCALICNFLH